MQVMLSDGRNQNKRPFQMGIRGLDHPVTPSRAQRPRLAELSVGRHDPVFPQSIIAQKCVLTLPPVLESLGEEDLSLVMAPIGQNLSACIPKHGEWAVARRPSDTTDTAPYSGGRYADLEVFTCANGLPIDYPIKFAGIMTNAQDLMDDNRDDVGGMDVAGTVSGINTGPDTMSPGDTVRIGMPYMILGPDGKTMIPGVTWTGMPTDKAHFGVYQLRWNDVDDALVDIKAFLASAYKQAPSAHFATETNLVDLLSVNRGVRLDMPHFWYAMITAHQLRVKDVIQSMTRAVLSRKESPDDGGEGSVVAMDAMLAYLQGLDDRHMKTLAAFDAAVGCGEVHYERSPIQSLVPLKNLSRDFLFTRLLDLMEEAERAKEIAQGRMHDFLKATCMGKVLASSRSGEQLDVLLGVFH
jgi:hypothetical protein